MSVGLAAAGAAGAAGAADAAVAAGEAFVCAPWLVVLTPDPQADNARANPNVASKRRLLVIRRMINAIQRFSQMSQIAYIADERHCEQAQFPSETQFTISDMLSAVL